MITEILINGESVAKPHGINNAFATAAGLAIMPQNARVEITTKSDAGEPATVVLFATTVLLWKWTGEKATAICESIESFIENNDEIFEFCLNVRCLNDDRTLFANAVCKLLVQKCDNDIDKALLNVKEIYDYFDEMVRHIYEVINKGVPLFALHNLIVHGASNYDFTEIAYKEAVAATRAACETFYIQKAKR